MRCGARRVPATLLAATLFWFLGAEAQAADGSVPDGQACEAAGRAAERARGIPDGLLLAIGQVESGRRDPLTRRVSAWPWALNVGGQGKLFGTREAALEALRASLTMGVRSIDVGCFQVNLLHHPTAFAGPEQALDPTANATYAAQFLAQLRVQSGSWEAAVGRYHSSLAERGEPYRADVLARWNSVAALVESQPKIDDGRFLSSQSVMEDDRNVVRVTAALRLPHVWLPSTNGAARQSTQLRVHLPRIVTPSQQ